LGAGFGRWGGQGEGQALQSIGFKVHDYAIYVTTFAVAIIFFRTLSYSALTLALGLTYFSAVVLLQPFFSGMLGKTNQVAVVASTLAIAALFHPLRRHIQAGIDRRFYRRKYAAEQILAAFGAAVRNETDMDRLITRLATVVQETLQPEMVSLWLRRTK
jgi:hypothetical protein